MKLYEISSDYLRLLDAIAEGDIPEEAIKDTLDALDGELAIKAESIAIYVKTLNAEAAAIKAEAEELTRRLKSKQSKADSMVTYLKETMQALEKEKIETPRCKLTIKNNPEALSILDEEKLKEWLKTNCPSALVVKPAEIDKAKIKSAVKEEIEVPFCELTRGTRLEIK